MSSAWFPSVGAVLHWFQTPANSAHSKTVPSSPQQPSVPRGADVWVFVTEDVSPLNKKEGDTFDKIEKWAPQLFIAFAATAASLVLQELLSWELGLQPIRKNTLTNYRRPLTN